MISTRAKLLQPSPTLAMNNRAKELQAQGKDVISLTVGEPDWPSFQVANEAAIQAINAGLTKYTPAHGIVELRKEIAKQVSEQLGVTYSEQQVVVSSGAKFVLYSILMMIIDSEDEVIIPSPFWVSYPTMAELAGAKVVVANCDEKVNFKLTAEILRKCLTKKTKVLILCSPSNPTGLQYSSDELKKLAEVLRDYKNVYIVSDDIYNQLIFSNQKMAPHILQIAPELKDRVFVVNGASKTFAMTGWRVGWTLGPQTEITAIADFLSQTTSNASTISQHATLAALKKGQPELLQAQKKLTDKMHRFSKEFQSISKIKLILPDGAFYFWLDVKECLNKTHQRAKKKLTSSKDIAEVLLSEHLLATVPGIEFGSEGYLRISFATSEDNLVKAIQRFHEFIDSLT